MRLLSPLTLFVLSLHHHRWLIVECIILYFLLLQPLYCLSTDLFGCQASIVHNYIATASTVCCSVATILFAIPLQLLPLCTIPLSMLSLCKIPLCRFRAKFRCCPFHMRNSIAAASTVSNFAAATSTSAILLLLLPLCAIPLLPLIVCAIPLPPPIQCQCHRL